MLTLRRDGTKHTFVSIFASPAPLAPPPLFNFNNIQIEIVQLDLGDIIICDNSGNEKVIVERKSLNDLKGNFVMSNNKLKEHFQSIIDEIVTKLSSTETAVKKKNTTSTIKKSRKNGSSK